MNERKWSVLNLCESIYSMLVIIEVDLLYYYLYTKFECGDIVYILCFINNPNDIMLFGLFTTNQSNLSIKLTAISVHKVTYMQLNIKREFGH